VFGLFWYEQSTRLIRDNALLYGQQGVDIVNDRLESSFSSLDRLTLPLLTHPLINSFLNTDGTDPYKLFTISDQVEKQLFYGILSARNDIQNLSVVSAGGNIISSFDKESALKAYELYKDTQVSKNNFDIRGVRTFDNIHVLTITRKIIDPYTYQLKGLVVIDMKYSEIAAVLEKLKLGKTDHPWVADANGAFIYNQDRDLLGRPVNVKYPKFAAPQSENIDMSESPNRHAYLITARLNAVNWLYVEEVPTTELIGSLTYFRLLTIVIGILVVVLSLLITGGFSVSLIRSLLLLQRLMKRAETGDFTVQAPERYRGEIGSLYRSFNNMVSELKRLIEEIKVSRLKEKELEIRNMESRLLAMQTQINPHFLYNTLEVVNSYALEANVKPISRMVNAMAGMFRYNLENPQASVTLHEEINHAKTYLNIQKERYGFLKVDLYVDEAVSKEVFVVRLVLQPLIENAFIHGYEEHQMMPEFLRITGKEEGGRFVVSVIDHGKGMPPETMRAINERFARTTVEQMASEQNFRKNGLGMWNVHSRLRMTFGEPYGLQIVKSDGEGTEIAIMLPRRDHYVSDDRC
jgi:two-component system sensor histidine kinase YesM